MSTSSYLIIVWSHNNCNLAHLIFFPIFGDFSSLFLAYLSKHIPWTIYQGVCIMRGSTVMFWYTHQWTLTISYNTYSDVIWPNMGSISLPTDKIATYCVITLLLFVRLTVHSHRVLSPARGENKDTVKRTMLTRVTRLTEAEDKLKNTRIWIGHVHMTRDMWLSTSAAGAFLVTAR